MIKFPRSFPGVIIALLFLMLMPYACDKPQARQTGDPAGIVMKDCTVCHGSQRICDSLGRKDRKEWDKTVKRMIDHGANLSPQDVPSVVDYLTGLKPGSKPVCE